MRVAVIGATGLVGQAMLKVLAERKFPVSELLPAASDRSAGRRVAFDGRDENLLTMEEALAAEPDIALFSAGADVSLQWAPRFAKSGCYVIDNSSAWRMAEGVPLVVPEVNEQALAKEQHIVANPNCSTIQLVMALKPLQDRYGLGRVVVSTYQSVTGTGLVGVSQLMAERRGEINREAYKHLIDQNCIPQIDDFTSDGSTKEEEKVKNESRKILGLPGLKINCTAVRVPTIGGHAESVNIQLMKPFEIEEVRSLLRAQRGVVVQDDPDHQHYPMPAYVQNRDEVFIGRIRHDDSIENGLAMWIVADNLRKGAATNAVQIAEAIERKGWAD